MDTWFNNKLENEYLTYKTEVIKVKKDDFNHQFIHLNGIYDLKYSNLNSPTLFTTIFQLHNHHITSTDRMAPGFGNKIIYTHLDLVRNADSDQYRKLQRS
ncbi:hypothetical protein A3Q56_04164 [Intoshia linei]|uniref:Uncharacterized protein n=1 Tax=Intoshia linei TaxID=1819745 RepID=A0A177B3V0_9BILA|nr:hypothetical protein A3Q56_04164 [Intoshia linei]